MRHKNRAVLQQGINHFVASHPFIRQGNFIVSHIRLSLCSLSVPLTIQMENFGWVEPFLIIAKDFLRVTECNQDFVAPAPSYIPIVVVSVRVREHQHEERTSSGVVSSTAAGKVSWSARIKEFREAEGRPNGGMERWKRDRDAQINR